MAWIVTPKRLLKNASALTSQRVKQKKRGIFSRISAPWGHSRAQNFMDLKG
jgi:hypothetical protein